MKIRTMATSGIIAALYVVFLFTNRAFSIFESISGSRRCLTILSYSIKNTFLALSLGFYRKSIFAAWNILTLYLGWNVCNRTSSYESFR